MSKLSQYRILALGILSPLAAVFLYLLVYSFLSWRSADLEKDWLFRLVLSTLAIPIPFLVTLVLAMKDRKRHALSLSAKIGLSIAVLSLGLALKPVSDGINRSKQERNMALRDVAAPPFAAVDLNGQPQSLANHKGEVVLVNLWATWCEPCRNEMPKLDQLYRDKKQQGFTVFGLSDEDAAQQRKFLKQIPVTYPLLIVNPQIPALYRDIARYPATFLIDRQGRLQPAPNPDQPFEKLVAAVDALLQNPPR
ncbi:MAG TPA: TlpA disulfide reductase family protein [Candidatus Acidoferrum sp.]|jgi:peroxiredoxin